MIYIQAASALALVLGLLGLFYYLCQRLNCRIGGVAPNSQIEVIERVPLGEKRSLLLVRVGQRQLLLGATGNAITLLSSVLPTVKPQENTAEHRSPESGLAKISFRRLLEAMR